MARFGMTKGNAVGTGPVPHVRTPPLTTDCTLQVCWRIALTGPADGNEATVARSALQRLLEDGLERLKTSQAAGVAAQLGLGVGGNCHHGNEHPEGAPTTHTAAATTGLGLCSTPSGELAAVDEKQLTTLAQPEDVAALKRLLQSPSDSSPAPPLPVSSHADASIASPPTTPTAAAREAAASEQQQHDWVVGLRTLCQLSAQGELFSHSPPPSFALCGRLSRINLASCRSKSPTGTESYGPRQNMDPTCVV